MSVREVQTELVAPNAPLSVAVVPDRDGAVRSGAAMSARSSFDGRGGRRRSRFVTS